MVIHRGIDGYSRLVVYLRCYNNNRASTVANDFVKLLPSTSYHLEFIVIMVEKTDVAKVMLTQRGFNRGSVIIGSSVYNQRIERLWRDIFQ